MVRREEEMTENHLGDNESEGDAPDDDDDLDEVKARYIISIIPVKLY